MLRKQTLVYVLASFLNTCFDVSKVLMPWLRTIEKRVRGQSLEGKSIQVKSKPLYSKKYYE